jgi:Sec-independent protein translocase protein TatA
LAGVGSNMFGIGGLELVLIFVVLVVVVRPEDLPAVLRKLGEWYGELQRVYYAILDELNHPRS